MQRMPFIMLKQRTKAVSQRPFAFSLVWGLVGVVAAFSGRVHAQSIEAQRYKTSQGVEVIKNRVAPPQAAAPVHDKPTPASNELARVSAAGSRPA